MVGKSAQHTKPLVVHINFNVERIKGVLVTHGCSGSVVKVSDRGEDERVVW